MKNQIEPFDITIVRRRCHGDDSVLIQYLKQFYQLVSERLILLNKAQNLGRRDEIKQLIHTMRPQIQFFGFVKTSTQLEELESSVLTMNSIELAKNLNSITVVLSKHLLEINNHISELNSTAIES